MTVADLSPSITYVENGVTVAFAAPFRFKAPQDLQAVRIALDGTSEALIYGTDYSATGGSDDAGGTVTVTEAAAAGVRLVITRRTPREQPMNYATADTFPAESHEGALDRLTLMVQEQDVDLDDFGRRALMVPRGEEAQDLPLAADRANLFLAFDPLGRPVTAPGTGADEGLREALGSEGGTDFVMTDDGELLTTALARLAPTATRQMQRAIQKLRRGEDCHIVVAGDSTGALVDRWVYRAFDDDIAARYPVHGFNYRLVEEDGSGYEAPIVIQTGTAGGGAPICTIWNASIPGAVSSRFAGQVGQGILRPAVIGGDPDLVVFNFGHNGLYDYETQLASLAGLIGETLRTMPMVPMVVIGQNPVLTDDTMAVKVEAFRAMTGMLNVGWLDVHEAFLEYPGDLADLYLDTVHPDTAGNILWARVFADAFRFDINGPAGNALSNLNRGVIFAQHLYSDLSGWELFNCTVEEETTGGFYETGGSSLKLIGTGAGGSAFMRKLVIPSTDISAFRNRMISATVRLLVELADADGGFTGRIALDDGVTTTTTPNGGPSGDGFVTQSVAHRVANASTGVYLIVYLHNLLPSSMKLRADRATVADGPIPRDAGVDVTGLSSLAQTSGSFSPTLVATGTDFDAVTYDGIRVGYWIRTGALVWFQITMRTDSVEMGAAAGQVALGELPLPAVGDAVISITSADGFAGDVPISGLIFAGNDFISLFYRATSNGADTALVPSDIAIGAEANTMILSGIYRVA